MPDTTLELSLSESGLDQLSEHNTFIGLHTISGEYSEENKQNIRNSYRCYSMSWGIPSSSSQQRVQEDLDYFTLQTKALGSFETSATIYPAIWRNIAKCLSRRQHCCANLNSHIRKILPAFIDHSLSFFLREQIRCTFY